MNKTVLVVEDDSLIRNFLAEGLALSGFEVTEADGLAKAFLQVRKSLPDLILTDYQLPDGTAFDLLNWLKHQDVRVPVILLTGHASIDLAVQAVKNGAEQFIPKPVDMGFLTTMLRRVLDNSSYQQKDMANKMERARYTRDPFIGESPSMRELERAATRAAQVNITVLIQGETGTGKGVLARWMHKMSSRSEEAFVDLNCAGLSRELFESELFGHQKGAFTGAVSNKLGFLEAANHGTLFLDEIGDMELQVQPKILKVVEEKRFFRLGDVLERNTDAHLIAATHRDLKKLAEDGLFRSDLYFRISALRLRIPPLRERLEDIPILTDAILRQLTSDMKHTALQISDKAKAALQLYDWPGNIRELRNVLERAALLSDDGVIHNTSLEFESSSGRGSGPEPKFDQLTLKEVEKRYILRTLESEDGNVIRSARILGIHRSSLYAKMREYAL
jgi:DNA-binding NtrC family response regulator